MGPNRNTRCASKLPRAPAPDRDPPTDRTRPRRLATTTTTASLTTRCRPRPRRLATTTGTTCATPTNRPQPRRVATTTGAALEVVAPRGAGRLGLVDLKIHQPLQCTREALDGREDRRRRAKGVDVVYYRLGAATVRPELRRERQQLWADAYAEAWMPAAGPAARPPQSRRAPRLKRAGVASHLSAGPSPPLPSHAGTAPDALVPGDSQAPQQGMIIMVMTCYAGRCTTSHIWSLCTAANALPGRALAEH